MKRENCKAEVVLSKRNIDLTLPFWVEDVDGNAVGHIEFEDIPAPEDLVFLEYCTGGRCFVVYTEHHDICNELLILEEISEQEFLNYSSEWEGVGTHIALGDENYI
jgi:hypothetical protein